VRCRFFFYSPFSFGPEERKRGGLLRGGEGSEGTFVVYPLRFCSLRSGKKRRRTGRCQEDGEEKGRGDTGAGER